MNGKSSPSQPPVTTTITINSQKIARDSLIHKNDVFQFDDVDSVHTNDVYFKLTPQSSSFESESTYQSNSVSKSSNINKNTNNIGGSQNKKKSKKLKKAKQSFANFITPIIRGVTNQDSNKPVRPQSVTSVASTPNMTSSSNNNKHNTLNSNGHIAGDTASQINNSAITSDKKESSIERSHTFTKKLNSFKSLISSRNKNNSSSNISKITEKKSEDSTNSKDNHINNINKNSSNESNNSNFDAINNYDAINFEKLNNLYVNNSYSPNKQLTINSSMNKYLNNSNNLDNDNNLDILNVSKSADIIVSTTSIASFTVKNRANIDDKDNLDGLTNEAEKITNKNVTNGNNNHLNEPSIELDVNRSNSLKIKSKSKLFDKFKLSNNNSNDKISNGSAKKK
jgi:hypothetical protein